MYFRRTASRFGQHSSKFFQMEGSILFYFFWWILTVLIEIYPKMTFRDFIDFFGPAPKIWTFFLTNLHFWEIGLYHSKDLLNSCLLCLIGKLATLAHRHS